MKKILLNNLSLKLLALLLGIILWIAVMYNLNPMVTRTISIPVNIENEDILTEKGWIYTIVGKDTIDVGIKAKSLDQAKISADDIYLYVDMRYLNGSTGTERRGTVQYRYSNSAIEGITLDEAYLTINLEQIVSRPYKIDVKVSGNVAENYTTGDEPTAVPESVTITGPISQVEKIAKVVYYLEINDASEDINETVKPILLDENGEELTDLTDITMSPDQVQICMPIYQTKNVSVICEGTVGEPATGYGISSEIILDTESVKIAGYKAIIADITSITIPAELINIEGIANNQTYVIDLDKLTLPEGVTLLGNDHTVNVSVKIEKKKQNNFRLKLPDDITIENKTSGISYTFDDSSIYITVEGLSEILSSLESANIIASINVDGLEPGVYNLPLEVILPDDVSLVKTVYIPVNIAIEETEPGTSEEPTTETPAPITTEEPVVETTINDDTSSDDETTEENTEEEDTTEEDETTDNTELTVEIIIIETTEDNSGMETTEENSETESETETLETEAEAEE